MNENQIADIWLLFKEYLDKKTLETVADRYVELMADYGVTDKALACATGTDETLDKAIEYYSKPENLSKLQGPILEEKTVDYILTQVKLNKIKVSAEDFSKDIVA